VKLANFQINIFNVKLSCILSLILRLVSLLIANEYGVKLASSTPINSAE
jgi:hypothetical protein